MAERNHSFTAISVAHQEHARDLFARYLTEAGLREAEPLATQLRMPIDGVFVSAQMQVYDAARRGQGRRS